MRKRIVVALVAALMAAGTVTAVAVPVPTPDPCQAVYASNTIANLQKYEKCRLDRIEAAIPGNQTVTVTAAPATVTVTAAPSTVTVTAQPTDSPTSATPSPTPTVEPTPEPTSASPTPTPTTTTTPPPANILGWQITADNTGLKPHGLTCSALPAYTGPSRPVAGTVISGQRITGAMYLTAGNITIEKSCFQPTAIAKGIAIVNTADSDQGKLTPGPGPVVIRDSEFDGSKLSAELAAWATGFIGVADLQRNYFHDLGSGAALMRTGTNQNTLVEGNYVTGLRAWGNPATDGNHNDAFTIRDFDVTGNANRTAIVRNNRFDCDGGNDTGAFFIQTYAGPIGNVTISGNLLEGGGYQMALEEKNYPYSNMRLTNNRMSGTGWGAGYVSRGEGWRQQSDNYVYDPTKTDGKGRAVSF